MMLFFLWWPLVFLIDGMIGVNKQETTLAGGHGKEKWKQVNVNERFVKEKGWWVKVTSGL